MSNLVYGSYIDGTDIYLRHGDSFYVALSIVTPDGSPYVPGDGQGKKRPIPPPCRVLR